MVTAKLMVAGISILFAILLGGMILGAILGLFKGLLVIKTGIHPFIIALGGLTIFRGLTLLVSDARPVFGFPSSFQRIVVGKLLGLPVPILIAVFVAFIFYLITTKRVLSTGEETLCNWW
jgi:D-allose transport system permease protein